MVRTRNAFAPVALSALLVACGSDDDDDGPGTLAPTTPVTVAPGTMTPEAAGEALLDGVVRLEGGTGTAAEAIGMLEAAIEDNENLGLVALVDHAANAENAGLTLPPTRVALFGNPRLGTPLMLASRTAGLDLPQRMLAWEDDTGALTLAWNDPAWIAARHGITGETMTVETIAGALEMLGTAASGGTGESLGDESLFVTAGAGVMTRTSGNDFETTYAALRDAVAGAGALTLVRELDHAMNAASVGLELPPTRLLVFGNPALGTPLMQSMRTIGLDLPQKMLVWEEDGVVTIAWNDPFWLAARHGIAGQDELLGRIAGALFGLADTAAGEGEGEAEDG